MSAQSRRSGLRALAAASVTTSFMVFLVQGCRGEVDRYFIDDTIDASGDSPISLLDGAAAEDRADGSGSIDTGPTSDAPNDGSGDAVADADAGTNDAGSDTGSVIDAADAADIPDGCGPPGTLTNCGGCGRVCNATVTSLAPLCNGTSCSYTCASNRVDCNSATAPNLDGCECAGTSCCGSGCQTTHSTGFPAVPSYYDCVPLGTYNETQARTACFAITGNAAQCTLATCVGNGGLAICTTGATCTCWKYDPGNSGVNGKVSSGSSCTCPGSANPSWD